MTAYSGISDLSLFKRRSSGNPELEALLELLPHATLIANASSGRIYFANTQAIQLSAYTRKELSELELSTLFPALNRAQLDTAIHNGSDPALFELVTRSSKTSKVGLTFSELGGPEHLVAITIQPASEIKRDVGSAEERQARWEALQILSAAAQQSELASCLRQILQAGHLMTGSSHLALYMPDGGEMELEAVWGRGLDFPAKLEASELKALNTARLWQTGKPIESGLHKLAHAAKFTYLASTPLNMQTAESGLLVACDEGAPAEDLLTMLSVLAASAATAEMQARLKAEMAARVEHLTHSNQMSRALQDKVRDGVVTLNRALQVETMNPAAASMLGYTTAEAEDRAASDILISAQPIGEKLETAFGNSMAEDLGEIKLLRRNGDEFLAQVRVAPIREGDDVARVVVLIDDLSENEALHVASQQLERRAWLGEVTAIFAHEVRNPINNISTGLQLMQMNFEDNDPMQEQIRRLQDDCDRLEHRMKSVLSFSRSLEHNPEVIDIGEFCQAQIERWRPRMARKNIEPHIQVETGTPNVLGDRRALDQVFTNLITNAIQAMEDQGSGVLAIKVKAGKGNEDFVDVHISDSGPGIPEDLRKKVFDPFFTTKSNEGTGLGLAITKRIIQAHKGEINVDSFPGGTLFKIKLPVAKD